MTSSSYIKLAERRYPAGLHGGILIFSGFDLDALFLDADGNMATAGDRTFASSFLFTAGTTRPTFGDSTLQPNGAHPGPVFGSLNGTTIDHATATLSVLDGISNANVNFANGFLTLGDGGSVTAGFSSGVSVGLTLYLMAGEVGGNGEDLTAIVTISDQPPGQVPLPAALPFFAAGAGALGFMGWRRKRRQATAVA